MPANRSENNLKMLKEWGAGLACPACHGALNLGPDHVTCTACGRVYPIEDGIPALVVERATLPSA
ncbi:MAG TPA: Trm112 family protein [Terracidiphilus sp.]|jgi:uncharacterized protein YbaR (Trm112 family)|nr:Trm112 family protein [Terracidiphilus sp.]